MPGLTINRNPSMHEDPLYTIHWLLLPQNYTPCTASPNSTSTNHAQEASQGRAAMPYPTIPSPTSTDPSFPTTPVELIGHISKLSALSSVSTFTPFVVRPWVETLPTNQLLKPTHSHMGYLTYPRTHLSSQCQTILTNQSAKSFTILMARNTSTDMKRVKVHQTANQS